MNNSLRLLTRDLRGFVLHLRAMAQRATPAPLFVRTMIFVVGAAALVVAFPPEIAFSGSVAALLGLALLAALFPRNFPPTLLILAAAAGWIANTAAHGVVLWRLFLLVALLYVVHSAAALGTVLSYDVVVAPSALVRWFTRAGLVIVASWGVGLVMLALPAYISGSGTIVFLVGGVALTMGLVVIIARPLRRR